MTRRHKLTAATVKAAQPTGRQYRISDGGGFGLALNVSKAGTKSWTQRLVIRRERCDLGLGSCHFVSLKEARIAAFENAKIARTGGDPRKPKLATFETVQEMCLEENLKNWKSSRTSDYWRSTMAIYVLPRIGGIPINEVSRSDIRHVLLPIAQDGKYVQAKTVGWRISQVLQWAEDEDLRSEPNPVAAVLKSLPRRKTIVRHHKALHYSDVAEALAEVAATQCYIGVKLAFRFMVLTAARSIEVRTLEWSDIDMETRVWHVPENKMKSEREHDVPLSSAAMDVLAEAERIRRGRFVFTGKNGKQIAQRTIRTALQDYAKIDATPHGMRSAFKEFCRNSDIPEELSELALAHTYGDSTRNAYAREELTEKRRPVMEQWAKCVTPGPTLDKFLAA